MISDITLVIERQFTHSPLLTVVLGLAFLVALKALGFASFPFFPLGRGGDI
jgi:hypothetical protein